MALNAQAATISLSPTSATTINIGGVVSFDMTDNDLPADSWFDTSSNLISMNYIGSSAIVNAVPVPAALWLFGSGFLGLAGIARHKKAV